MIYPLEGRLRRVTFIIIFFVLEKIINSPQFPFAIGKYKLNFVLNGLLIKQFLFSQTHRIEFERS